MNQSKSILLYDTGDFTSDLWGIFSKHYPMTNIANPPLRQKEMVEEMARYVFDKMLDYKAELRRLRVGDERYGQT